MNKKILKNYLYNLTYQMLNIIIPIITAPYISRVLGASGIGDYNYVYGIVTYFGIFAATGTATYGQREIAKNEDNLVARSTLFWDVLTFRIMCSCLVTLIYVLFFLTHLSQYRVLFIVNLFMVASWFIDVSWYFQGVENFSVTAVRNSLVRIISTILIFSLVRRKDEVWLFTLIMCLSAFLGNLTMLPYLKKEIKFVKVHFRDVLSHFKGIMSLFLPVIAIQFYTVLNRVMLGSMSSTQQVGYYSQANQMINIGTNVIYAFVAVLTPRIAALFSEGKKDEIKKYMSQSIANVYFLGLPMMFGIIGISNIFVPIFFGSGYHPVIGLINVMSVLFLIIGIGQLVGTFLISTDKQNLYTLAVTVAAVLNVIFNYLFIKMGFSAMGVAYATIISEVASTTVEIISLRSYIHFPDFILFLIKYLVPSVLMFVVIKIVSNYVQSNAIKLISMIFTGVCVYSLYMIVTKDELVYPILRDVGKKLKSAMHK